MADEGSALPDFSFPVYSLLVEALRSIILIPGIGSVVTTRIARAS